MQRQHQQSTVSGKREQIDEQQLGAKSKESLVSAIPPGLMRQAVLSLYSQSIRFSPPTSRSLSANVPSVHPMYRGGGEMQ